jgi:hypothetical protein
LPTYQEQQVAQQQNFDVIAQRGKGIERQQDGRQCHQQRGERGRFSTVAEAQREPISGAGDTQIKRRLHQPHDQHALAQQFEGQGDEISIQRPHIVLPVEECWARALSDVARHQRHDGLVCVEGDAAVGNQPQLERRSGEERQP